MGKREGKGKQDFDISKKTNQIKICRQRQTKSCVFFGAKEIIHLLEVTNREEGEGEVDLVLAPKRFGRRVGLGERPEVERVEATEASEGEDQRS